jgi:hypothetical protein
MFQGNSNNHPNDKWNIKMHYECVLVVWMLLLLLLLLPLAAANGYISNG